MKPHNAVILSVLVLLYCISCYHTTSALEDTDSNTYSNHILMSRYLRGRKQSFTQSKGGMQPAISFQKIQQSVQKPFLDETGSLIETDVTRNQKLTKYEAQLAKALKSMQRMSFQQTLLIFAVGFLASLTSVCLIIYRYRKELRPCVEFIEWTLAKTVEWVVYPIRLVYKFIVGFIVYPLKSSYQTVDRWIQEYYHPSLITAHHF